MNTSTLLTSLLEIAGLTQKKFAELVGMSPSTLSQIISGNQHIRSDDSSNFCSKAARVLAHRIYSHRCFIEFKDLFPVIIDFYSRHDLEQFLLHAFHYVIDNDREAREYSPAQRFENKHYSGYMQVLYMYCIIFSDYLLREDNSKMEFYSSLALFFGPFAKLYDRIETLLPPSPGNITYYHLFNPEKSIRNAGIYSTDVLKKIHELELFSDVYYMESDVDVDRPLFMLKDRYILLFSQQIDGTLQMTLLRNPADLAKFHDYMLEERDQANRRSFNQDEIEEFMLSHPDSDPDLNEKIMAIARLSNTEYQTPTEELVADFFKTVLRNDAALYLSADLISSFLYSTEAFGSYLNCSDLPLQVCTDYIDLVSDYLQKYRQAKVYLVNTPLDNLTVICQGKLSVLSLVNPRTMKLKYHLLDTALLGPDMERLARETAIGPGEYFRKLNYDIEISQQEL